MNTDEAYIYRSHSSIMRAGLRGAISPSRALYWAGEIAAGRAVPEQVDMLASPDTIMAAENEFMAQAGDLSQQVRDALEGLRGALDGLAGQRSEPAPPEFRVLFPDHARAAGLLPSEPPNMPAGRGHYPAVNPRYVYPGEQQGEPVRDPNLTWDGYVAGSADGRKFATDFTPFPDNGQFASSSDDEDDDEWVWVPDEYESVEEYEASRSGSGEPQDDEADGLWPPRTRAEAEGQFDFLIAAAGQDTESLPYSERDVHQLLFGDSWFSDGESDALPGDRAGRRRQVR